MYWSRNLLVFATWLAAGMVAGNVAAVDDFQVAADLVARQDWEAAADELATFIAEHPESARANDARYLLGESLVQRRRYAEARAQFERFLEATDQHRYRLQAEFRAAEAAFQLADYRAARRGLETFRGRYPDHHLSLYAAAYLGELALIDGDGPAARKLFEEAVDGSTNTRLRQQCRFGLAQALERCGAPQPSLAIFSELAESGGPYALRARCRIAIRHYRDGDYEQASRLLTPLAESSEALLRFESQYWLGMTQLARQDWQSAATTLRAGLVAQPRHSLQPARRFALAEALRKGGHPEEAADHLRVLAAHDPPVDWSDDAAQLLSQIAWDAGDLAAVHDGATHFATRFPSSPLISAVRQVEGRAYLKEQDFDAAIAVFEQLLGEHDAIPTTDPPGTQQESATRSANRYYLAIAYLGADRPADVLRVLPKDDNDGDVAGQLAGGLQVARASALLALGRYGQAIGPLEAYVAAHDEGVDRVASHARLVVALAETGQWYAAAESFQLFRERHPDAPTLVKTAVNLAELAHRESIHDVAEPLYRFLISRHAFAADHDGEVACVDPPGPRQHLLLGLLGLARSQFARGMTEEAAATALRLLMLSPPDDLAVTALLLRGRALEARGEGPAAVECYQLVTRHLPEHSGASTAWYAAARVLTQQGRYAAAAAELDRLLARSPNLANRDTVLYQQAWLYLDMNQPVEADRRFAELVRRYQASPLWADSVFRLARNAAARQEVDRAQQWIDELLFGVARHPALLAARPEAAQGNTVGAAVDATQIVCHALYLQGKLAVDTRRWLAALRSYHRIVEEFPESELAEAAAFWSAEACFQLSQLEQADAMFAELARSSVDPPRERQAMICLRRAQIAAHRQQWGTALAEAQVIEGRYPGFSLQFEVDYLVGRCLSTEARFSMARQAFRQVTSSPAAQRTETAAMAQWMIGETYFHQSNYDAAIRAYDQVVQRYKFPQWRAAALLQAAKCHELNGQPLVAAEVYAKVRRHYPRTTYAAAADQRLRVANRIRPE